MLSPDLLAFALSPIETIIIIVTGFVGLVTAFGTILYAVAKWRQGEDEAKEEAVAKKSKLLKDAQEALETSQAEVKTYRDRMKRLEDDINEMKLAHARDITELNTKVDLLTQENETLRSLVTNGGLGDLSHVRDMFAELFGQQTARLIEVLRPEVK